MSGPGSFRRLEDLEREWNADPEMQEVYRQEVPYADVAMAIIRLRVRHGLSQSEFAAKVGRPQSYIARLESGRANVEVGTLKAFAEALGARLNLSYEEQGGRSTFPGARGRRGPSGPGPTASASWRLRDAPTS